MKLIIDIPEDYYEIIKYHVDNHQLDYRPFEIIANGTPLDDVKAELASKVPSDKLDDAYVSVPYVFKVLDKTGKAESEDT
jgi:hypothetical protein